MSTSTPTKLVHLTILIKKVDNLSHEEFHSYWANEHPKIWLSVPIVRTNVLKYTQFHIDEKVTAGLKAAGLPVAKYDGGVQMWAKSIEELMAVFHDPVYLAKVVPDEETFLKRAEATMMIGWDEELWTGEK